MALLDTFCPLFGRSSPKVIPGKIPKFAPTKKPKLSRSFFCRFFCQTSQIDVNTKLKARFETQNGPAFLHKFRNRFNRRNQDEPKRAINNSKAQTIAFETT